MGVIKSRYLSAQRQRLKNAAGSRDMQDALPQQKGADGISFASKTCKKITEIKVLVHMHAEDPRGQSVAQLPS